MSKTDKVIAFLQECFELKEQGKSLSRNLNYNSKRGILTDEYVERLAVKIEAEFEHELKQYPEYHFNNADGATVPPGFTAMSLEDKRAMAEGLDRVLGYEDTR